MTVVARHLAQLLLLLLLLKEVLELPGQLKRGKGVTGVGGEQIVCGGREEGSGEAVEGLKSMDSTLGVTHKHYSESYDKRTGVKTL